MIVLVFLTRFCVKVQLCVMCHHQLLQRQVIKILDKYLSAYMVLKIRGFKLSLQTTV